MSRSTMPTDQPLTTIYPTDPSLDAHLAALDLLAAKIAALPSRTRWPARIPLNSKASMLGQVVHTNELKVNVGSGYWIEMTAKEAEEYVKRRKTDLLLSHAGLRENLPRSTRPIEATLGGLPATIDFNPIFGSAAVAGPSKQKSEAVSGKAQPKAAPAVQPEAIPKASSAPTSDRKGKGREVLDTPLKASISSPAPTRSDSTQAQPRTLQDIMEQFLEMQQGLSKDSQDDIAKLNGSQSEDALVNEEGLPIHEIREDMDGKLIGEAPVPTANGILTVEEPDEDVDWQSEEARRRREAKKRLIFGDDDDEEEEEEEDSAADSSTPNNRTTASAIDIAGPSSTNEDAQATPSRSPSPPPRRLSNTPNQPPRSILKPPARKKSVSFDESVPIPPDSPPPSNTKAGFPLPMHDFNPGNDEFEPRPVPILPIPKPAVKSAVGENFGGFKRGFLDRVSESSSVAKKTAGGHAAVTSTSPDPKTKKGPSLFAQRMAAQEHPKIEEIPNEEPPVVKPSREPISTAVKAGIVERVPPPATAPQKKVEKAEKKTEGLPRMSEQKPMTTMLNSVVEKAPAVAALPPTVQVDAPASLSRAGSSTAGSTPQAVSGGTDVDIDDDVDDDEDLPGDDEEEDEYDLDDALLAREVALEYHRRQAYMSMANRGLTGDEVDMDGTVDPAEMIEYDSEADDADDELREVDDPEIGTGGVMMGLPQISTDGQIINPTPDDIRKYVRVGRLENGNLVLAPGEEGWSDEEDEGKARHREELRRQILGLEVVGGSEGVIREKEVVGNVGLPPAVITDKSEQAVQKDAPQATASVERPRPAEKPEVKGVKEIVERQAPASATTPLVEVGKSATATEPPKKVSRFKAARMGQ